MATGHLRTMSGHGGQDRINRGSRSTSYVSVSARSAFCVTQDRGKVLPHGWAKSLLATIHPSALLRAPDPATRGPEYRLFVEDLRLIPKIVNAVRLPAA